MEKTGVIRLSAEEVILTINPRQHIFCYASESLNRLSAEEVILTYRLGLIVFAKMRRLNRLSAEEVILTDAGYECWLVDIQRLNRLSAEEVILTLKAAKDLVAAIAKESQSPFG